jgi:hypothetical protein
MGKARGAPKKGIESRADQVTPELMEEFEAAGRELLEAFAASGFGDAEAKILTETLNAVGSGKPDSLVVRRRDKGAADVQRWVTKRLLGIPADPPWRGINERLKAKREAHLAESKAPKVAFRQKFIEGVPDGEAVCSDEYIIPTDNRVRGVVLEFAAYKKPAPALREAPATKGEAKVDKSDETSYNKLMLDQPNNGGAELEQKQSQLVQLARDIGFAATGKLLVGAASPEEQRALKTGMAECAREVTSPEPPPSPVVMTPQQQLAELTVDTTLGRLQVRYEKRLRKIDLPNDKITNVEQARAARSLVVTYRNLVEQQTKLGLAPQPQDEKVLKAQRLSVAFYREQKAGPTPRRRGRPPKFPMNALA